MRNNMIQEMLDEITPEEHVQFEREFLEDLAFSRWLEEQGYEDGTDSSYSLKLLNDAGYYPIAISYFMGEEAFSFTTEKEAKKAWESRTLGWDGWWYGKRSFLKTIKEYEAEMDCRINIYWL